MTITGQNLLPRLNFPQVMVEKKKTLEINMNHIRSVN